MALDANGIWQYEETDSEATASDLLNLGMAAVSDRIGDLVSDLAAVESENDSRAAFTSYSESALTWASTSGAKSAAFRKYGNGLVILQYLAVQIGTTPNGGPLFELPSHLQPVGTAIVNLAANAPSITNAWASTTGAAASLFWYATSGTPAETTYLRGSGIWVANA